MFKFLFISGKKSRDEKTDLLGGGGQEGQLPLLPFARRGKGGGGEVPFEL
jgi:hypothetical protein